MRSDSLITTKIENLPKYPNTLQQWVKRRRLKLTHLAEKTNIPIRSLHEYVAGEAAIPEERLKVLAEALDCQAQDLLPQLFAWNIPHQRNPFFTGRDDLLENLHETFRQNQRGARTYTLALCGLAGVGKTQIANEYVYRYYDDYEAFFWLKADTRENLVADMMTIATHLGLPEQHLHNQAQVLTAVQRWFRTHEKWLLIFDNADDLTMVREFLPYNRMGHILLTTRSQSLGRLAQRLEVKTMNTETGTLFLLRRASLLSPDAPLTQATENQRHEAQQIVQQLGGLPLALDQCGGYIEDVGCSLTDYLALYQARYFDLLNYRGGVVNEHPEPVTTTLLLSFNKLEQDSPAAADLLRLCSFLHPDAIPLELFIGAKKELGLTLEQVANDQLRLNATIGDLLKLSFIHRDATNNTLSIHRLTQLVIKSEMDEATQRFWAECAVRAVNQSFPNPIGSSSWHQCQRLLVQAQSCIDLIERWDFHSSKAMHLLNHTAYHIAQRGRYQEAERLLERSFSY